MQANAAQKNIYRVAIILTVLTAIEFLIAFLLLPMAEGMGLSAGTASLMKVLLFIILTIFKAFYIVSEFMHLGGEVKRLIFSVILPFIFIVWLIIGMLVEGNFWGKSSPNPIDQNVGSVEKDVPYIVEHTNEETVKTYYV